MTHEYASKDRTDVDMKRMADGPVCCRDCFYWQPYDAATYDTENPDFSISWDGACCRYPPTRAMVDDDWGWWQSCSNAWEWCGEWKPERKGVPE